MEEWIESDDSEHQFIKYLNNRFPASCVQNTSPFKAHLTAQFLIFSQYVQWEKTDVGAFISDYQGVGRLLTDPQITSNPYVLHLCFPTALLISLTTSVFGYTFGPGNIPAAFTEFRATHICNDLCRFFGLFLDIPPPEIPSTEPLRNFDD